MNSSKNRRHSDPEGNNGKRRNTAHEKQPEMPSSDLVAAGQRLLTVITRNKGGANKDLSKFADQINSLSRQMGQIKQSGGWKKDCAINIEEKLEESRRQGS